MSHQIRLEGLRKEIRREQISEFMAHKRTLLATNQPIITRHFQTALPTLSDLQNICATSKKQHQIEQLHLGGWLSRLQPFLQSHFHGSLEQLYASYAMCNLLLIGQPVPPSLKLTSNLVQILETSNIGIIDNVITIFFNLIYDHPQWCNQLVEQFSFASKLNHLFKLQATNRSFVQNLLRTIQILLSSARQDPSLMAFAETLIMQVRKVDNQTLQLTLRSISILCRMFPEELAEKIIQNKIVSNLGPIIKNTSHIKILEPYIHIVTLVCQKLAPKDFSVHILPLIELHRNGSRNMRLRCYRLLYNSLEESILAASQFWKNRIREPILQEFEEEEDKQILIELSYIFSLCLLNLPLSTSESNSLKNHLQRASKIIDDDIEVQGFIDETIQMHHSLYQ